MIKSRERTNYKADYPERLIIGSCHKEYRLVGGCVGGEEVGWKRRRVKEEGRVKDGRGVDGKGSNCPFNC